MRRARVSTVVCIFAGVCLILEILLYTVQEIEQGGARRHIFLIEYSEEIRKKAGFLIAVSMAKLGYLNSSQIDEGNAEMSCHLPKLEPFNLLAFKHTWMRSRVFCSKHHPQIYTSSLSNSIIRLENPAIYKYRNCCYTPFSKIEGQEKQVEYSKDCIRLDGPRTQVDESVEFARVTCLNNEFKTVPVDFFGFIHPKTPHFNNSVNLAGNPSIQNSSQTSSSQKETKKERVNVIVLLIDSISNLNFQRVMPKSFEYLKSLGAIAMNGFSKVGENTFPNLVPILTGLTIKELRQVCWPNRSSHFDDCPFIWKNYSSQGYLTAYGEDAPTQSAFLWERKGFKKAPTDYYWNPLTYQMDHDLGHEWIRGSNWCYGPRLGMEVVTEFLKKMAHQMKQNRNQNYFQFGLTGSLTHGLLKGGKVAETPLLKYLKWFEKYDRNETVLILMSDHGMRFGDFRSTLQGRIEEQMPFIHFLFPRWFSLKTEYQNALGNLKSNGKRLTTHFDLYETLLDLLFLQNITNERVLQRQVKLSSLDQKPRPRGISLFLPIQDRNCEDAGIPDHYCVCHVMKEIPVKGNPEIREAAQFIVRFINKILLEFPECQQLTLESVNKAYLAEVVQRNPDPGKSVRFSLVFSTLPNNATFEGTTTKQKNGSWTTSEELSRVDFYGRQSWCVDDYRMKKFCYCANSE